MKCWLQFPTYCVFTKLHLLRFKGRNAWSGGIVAISLTKSQVPFDSSWLLTCTR